MRLSITNVAAEVKRTCGVKVPVWKLRRVIDDLHASGAITIQRAGQFRTLADGDIEPIVAELRRLGWLPEEAVASCK